MAATSINRRGDVPIVTDPLRNFRFMVRFYPYWSGSAPKLQEIPFGFTSVSGLSAATEAIPYREGGMNTTLHQIPGQTTFSPITLSRGVHLGSDHAWAWLKRMFSVVGGTDGASLATNFRAMVDIWVIQHPANRQNDSLGNSDDLAQTEGSNDDKLGLGFRVYNAWIQSVAYSDMNAGDNAVLVEQMVLAHEGFDMRWPDSTSNKTANEPFEYNIVDGKPN